MDSSNLAMLEIVAEGLGELIDEMVFVGGAVAELYADNPALSEIRPTLDVDCVVELSSRKSYFQLEEKLRTKGFVNDLSKEAPICRWIYNFIKVDIMPTDEKILGFSNQWYVLGIENKIRKTLSNGSEIFVFPINYYLASKFEAHQSRGGNDLRQSHDFEDIVYVLDNSKDILISILSGNHQLKKYLKEQCKKLDKNPGLTEGVESALPYGAALESVQKIENIIKTIANL